MLARLLPIIAPRANVSVVTQFEYSIQLMLKTFLRTKDIEIMEAHQTLYHFLTVGPRIEAIIRRIHPQIERCHLHPALGILISFSIHRTRSQQYSTQDSGTQHTINTFHLI